MTEKTGDATYWKTRHALLGGEYKKLIELLKDAHPHIADDSVRARVGNAIAKATGSEAA